MPRQTRREGRRRATVTVWATALVVVGTMVGNAAGDRSAGAAGPGSWPTYLFSAAHSSEAPGAVAVTPATATALHQAWNFLPPGGGAKSAFISSPTVVNGVIFIGANNGTFYALAQSTGAVVWQVPVGRTVPSTCGGQGFASTATVAADPVTAAETVYVAGPDGYLYALDARTGSVVWRSVVGVQSPGQNDYFDWASPVVANGRVYMGVASQCDHPLVRGGVLAFDQHSGSQLASFFDVPAGSLGGSVWSTPAMSTAGVLYVTTGNGPRTNQFLGTSDSIVALNGTSLADLGSRQLPAAGALGDSDFGGSPTLFTATLDGATTATPMVGVCNKNGWYYALRRNNLAAGPVWSLQVGAHSNSSNLNECIAAAVWNGSDLFIAGPPTTIAGLAYNGSIREVDPSTGSVLWATGLSGDVDGSPSLDGAGVVSVATFDSSGAPNADYLVSAATGTILATVSTGNAMQSAQPVFVGKDLLLATSGQGLFDYRVGP